VYGLGIADGGKPAIGLNAVDTLQGAASKIEAMLDLLNL
jgi:hypothetical protein